MRDKRDVFKEKSCIAGEKHGGQWGPSTVGVRYKCLLDHPWIDNYMEYLSCIQVNKK
jgi:hypothetical protein